MATEASWIVLRMKRNAALDLTDWTQLVDAPAGIQAAYFSFRRTLRDLPAVTEDPECPAWPEIPDIHANLKVALQKVLGV